MDWPQFNHDGGDLVFGPRGLFYFSMGDGGGADDTDVGHVPGGNAQNLTNALGKILRIDVDGRNSHNGQYGIPADNPLVGRGSGIIEEIYAFGFRNPFRLSFDRLTRELYTGDVGQNDIEEVNRVFAGRNYGWNRKEGTLFFNPNGDRPGFATPEAPGPVPPGLVDPIAQYDTHHEGHSVIGGYVYRGMRIRELRGRYVFGDYSQLSKFPFGPHDYGRLFHMSVAGIGDGNEHGLAPIYQLHIAGGNALGLAVLGFAEDATGELYVLGNVSGTPFGTRGHIVRIAPL